VHENVKQYLASNFHLHVPHFGFAALMHCVILMQLDGCNCSLNALNVRTTIKYMGEPLEMGSFSLKMRALVKAIIKNFLSNAAFF